MKVSLPTVLAAILISTALVAPASAEGFFAPYRSGWFKRNVVAPAAPVVQHVAATNRVLKRVYNPNTGTWDLPNAPSSWEPSNSSTSDGDSSGSQGLSGASVGNGGGYQPSAAVSGGNGGGSVAVSSPTYGGGSGSGGTVTVGVGACGESCGATAEVPAGSPIPR